MTTLRAEDFDEMDLKLSVVSAAINAVKCATDRTDEISLDGASINTLMYVASDHLEEIKAILNATDGLPTESIPDDLKVALANIANDEERTLSHQIIYFLRMAVGEYGEKKKHANIT